MDIPSKNVSSGFRSRVRYGAHRGLVSVAAATAFTLVGAGAGTVAPAFAHDQVVKSNPQRDSTVDELPAKLVLDFSGAPQDGFNTIALSRDGEVLFKGEPKANGRELSLELPADLKTEPGEYTVGYQITSSDGHATRGSYTFTLGGASTAREGSGTSESPDAATSGESQGDAHGSVPTWLLPVGGIVVLLGALALAIQRFRATKQE